MPTRLGALAEHLGAELHGDADVLIQRIATLDSAGCGDVAFLFNRRYRRFLAVTGASAVILGRADLATCPVAALVTENPYLGYARAAALLYPSPDVVPGIHATAHVAAGAEVDDSAAVGAYAVVGAGAKIGAGADIGPSCVIGPGVRIGAYTRLCARVTVMAESTLGRRCLVHPGAVIGADGFGLARERGVWIKIPQIGSVHIGDDVEIGANTTIDRGALKDTVIEDGVKLDNLIQIGHNARIGAHTAVAGCVGISGSTRIGKRCTIGGGAGFAGHIEICDDVVIGGATSVTKSIRKAATYSSVWPAREALEWRRSVGRFNRLGRRGAGDPPERTPMAPAADDD
ncbi:MAG: UDP-3-O-(3-hydroxymyristoyl)glucosamine N-acyltransferase [Gammaproteobacteria bacterium]